MNTASTSSVHRYALPARDVQQVVREFRKTAATAVESKSAGDDWLTAKSRQVSAQMGGFQAEPGGPDATAQEPSAQTSGNGSVDDLVGFAQQLLAPIDNVMALSKLLADNIDRHLAPRQVDYAQTIYASATELRSLIERIMAPGSIAAEPPAAVHMSQASAARGAGSLAEVVAPAERMLQAAQHARLAAGGEERIVIVEGDPDIATMMLELARENGYRGIVISRVAELRALVRKSPPDAIILGMKLADADGCAALDVLRHDPDTRPIPLCLIAFGGRLFSWLELGDSALSALPADFAATAALESRRWRDGEEAPGLPGIPFNLLDGAVSDQRSAAAPLWHEFTPLASVRELMLAGTARGRFDAAPEVTRRLSISYGDGTMDMAILSQSDNLEGLLEGAMLFLHHAVSEAPRSADNGPLAGCDPVLAGSKALLIDDDMRHIYAMTGAFEDHGMRVIHAENEMEALAALEREPDVGIVLLDVTMAGLDAEDLMRRMRSLDAFKTVPIIVLTDADDSAGGRNGRARWRRAGASDDIARPANVEQLLSLVRAHLAMARSG